MPQYRKSNKSARTKTVRRRRHTKKAPKRKHMMRGGFAADCEQAATIMEPGLDIKSFLTDGKGLTIPSSRALLSGSMPACIKGSHP